MRRRAAAAEAKEISWARGWVGYMVLVVRGVQVLSIPATRSPISTTTGRQDGYDMTVLRGEQNV